MIMDGDILFSSPDWYTSLSAHLDNADIVHPFEKVCYLGFDYITKSDLPSIVVDPTAHSSSGHVWAFRRRWWEENPLYNLTLVGGGDVVFCKQIGLPTDRFASSSVNIYHPPQHPFPKVTYMRETVYHLAHGPSDNRQYLTRHHKLERFMAVHGITHLEECFKPNAEGIFECDESIRNAWNAMIKTYFEDRCDDGL